MKNKRRVRYYACVPMDFTGKVGNRVFEDGSQVVKTLSSTHVFTMIPFKTKEKALSFLDSAPVGTVVQQFVYESYRGQKADWVKKQWCVDWSVASNWVVG